MKSIFIAAILALTAWMPGLASAQPLPRAWQDWIVTNEPLLSQKDHSIQEVTDYRNQVCQSQSSDKARTDCQAKFQEVLSGLILQRNLFSGELLALKKLPTDEATALTWAGRQVYVQLEADTAAKEKAAKARYPRRQARE